jgi:hypothetical protein
MLSEWSSAPLQSFGLYMELDYEESVEEPEGEDEVEVQDLISSTNTPPSDEELPAPPTRGRNMCNSALPSQSKCQVLEDDRLLLPVVNLILKTRAGTPATDKEPTAAPPRSARLVYKCRLVTASLFENPARKPRLSGFLFCQARELLLGGHDIFFSPSEVIKLCALNIIASFNSQLQLQQQQENGGDEHSYASRRDSAASSNVNFTPPPIMMGRRFSDAQSSSSMMTSGFALPEIVLSKIISKSTIDYLPAEDWMKSIQQELADIAEHMLESGDIREVTELEKLELEHKYYSTCFKNHHFGLEFWQGFSKVLDIKSQAGSEVIVEVSLLRRRNPPKDVLDLMFDVDPDDTAMIGINCKGITCVARNNIDPSRSGLSGRGKSTIFTWDLFSIKCWSYSRTIFSWTELGTEVEFSVDTQLGYFMSGLLMDYALTVVKEKGADPPCLKYQSLDQLGWKGTIIWMRGSWSTL